MAHKENYKHSASLIHHQHITLYGGVRCLYNTYFMTIKKKTPTSQQIHMHSRENNEKENPRYSIFQRSKLRRYLTKNKPGTETQTTAL